MQLPRAVRRDDDDRRHGRADRSELGNGDLKVGQQLEQEPLELFVRAIQLVDQQNRGSISSARQGLEQRTLDQELFAEELLGGRPAVDGASRLHQPDFEELPRIVPLVHGVADIEAFVALQPYEVDVEARREHLCDVGLADARLALEEERALQLEGEINRRGQTPIGDVELALEQRLQLLDRRDGGGQHYATRAAAAVRARLTHTGATAFR